MSAFSESEIIDYINRRHEKCRSEVCDFVEEYFFGCEEEPDNVLISELEPDGREEDGSRN